MNPDLRFLLSHPSHCISLGFGVGLIRRAPGTWGTLAGWALFPLLTAPTSEPVFVLLLISLFAAGVLATDRTGKALGVPDHGAMVWDEMVAIWLILMFTPPTIAWQGTAVVLFRVFDIAKPPPIRQVERKLKGGLGVMVDDVLAAGYTLLVLAVLVRFAPF